MMAVTRGLLNLNGHSGVGMVEVPFLWGKKHSFSIKNVHI